MKPGLIISTPTATTLAAAGVTGNENPESGKGNCACPVDSSTPSPSPARSRKGGIVRTKRSGRNLVHVRYLLAACLHYRQRNGREED
ncbi:hypothetical protein L873DRAFT_1806066 [Choiromyces venosus 120613-1]|uniref:Uncharacterized protein n=1 Tax=Choiromyces venosus 120613-1 TaxID=1336337 RepID=A0A3N4JNZ5_9PEZI|nr:hypothetical protein L873DRAFT_1806066 [Choiromyces venosus 120613-1]